MRRLPSRLPGMVGLTLLGACYASHPRLELPGPDAGPPFDADAPCAACRDLGEVCESGHGCREGHCYLGRCAPNGMAFIPAGRFLMGSPPTEIGRIPGEDQHEVELSRDFFLGIYEVTQGEFRGLTGLDVAYYHSCGDDCPIESLVWSEALLFANRRSESEGLQPCYDMSGCTGTPGGSTFYCEPTISFDLDCPGYRLATEAEWEYAYRAGTTTAYHNGEIVRASLCDQPLMLEVAQFCGNCSVPYAETFDCSSGGVRPELPPDCGPVPVGRRRPNAWGLYDMSGNVGEMLWDVLAPYPAGAVRDPIGPPLHDLAGRPCVRGGSFCGHMARLRAADRKFIGLTARNPGYGLRIARTRVRPGT